MTEMETEIRSGDDQTPLQQENYIDEATKALAGARGTETPNDTAEGDGKGGNGQQPNSQAQAAPEQPGEAADGQPAGEAPAAEEKQAAAKEGGEDEGDAGAKDADKKDEGELPKSVVDAFTELQRREAQLTRGQQDLKRREEAVESKEGSVADLQTLAKKDPIALLEKFGISYADLTRHVVNGRGAKPDDQNTALARDVAAIKEQIENQKKQQEEAQQAQTRQSQERDARGALDKNDNLRLSKHHGDAAVRWAVDIADRVEQDTGERPPYEAVLERIEKHYAEEAKTLTQLLNPGDPQTPGNEQPPPQNTAPAATEAQSKQAPSQKAPQPETPQTAAAQSQTVPAPTGSESSSKTLSNDLSSNSGAAVPQEPQTEEDYREAAARVLRAQRQST